MSPGENSPSRPLGFKKRAAERVGQVTGRWHLDALLGVGGMAAVYAATDVTGHRAALKLLHACASDDPLSRARFAREAWVARHLKHPCLVEVFDDGATEGQEPFLAMEQLEGQSVEALCKRAGGVLPAATVLRIMERVLDALGACHARGVIHRDLKPANLFVTTDGRVKLLDFGVAQVAALGDEPLPPGAVVGTPHFMAPEQAAGAWDQVDERADLFAAGATMYTLLSGARLNRGSTEAESFQLAASHAAPSLRLAAPDLEPQLVALVDRALSWDKHARPADAQAMRGSVVEALARVDDGTSTLTAKIPRARERVSLPAPAKHPAATGRRSGAPPSEGGSIAVIPPAPSLPREFDTAPLEDVAARQGRILTDAFALIERLLSSVVEHGFRHAELRSQLAAVHALLVRALRPPATQVALNVFPFCLTCGDTTVWEPPPPLDAVPHALYAAGVRVVRLTPGLSVEQVRELVEVLLPDAAHLGEGHADVLGLEQLAHVELECVLMPMRGDGRAREQFIQQADAVECALREAIEQAAWDMAPASQGPAAAALKQATRVPQREWSRRWAHAMLEGWELSPDAAWAALRCASARGRARGYQAIFMLHAQVRAAMAEQLPGRLTPQKLREAMTAVLEDQDTRALLQAASQLRAELLAGAQPWNEATPDIVLAWVRELLGVLGDESFDAVLDSLPGMAEPGVEEAAAEFLEQHAAGREQRLGEALGEQRAAVADRLLGIIASLQTPSAGELLRRCSVGSAAGLRLLSYAHAAALTSGQRSETLELLEHADPELRWAALRAAESHRLQEAAALAAARVSGAPFHGLRLEEREGLLRVLASVAPDSCERLTIEMVSQHGIIGDKERSESRVLAATLLGRTSSSHAAVAALHSASLPLWWNPPAVRQAAAAAIAKVQARMSGSAGGSAA